LVLAAPRAAAPALAADPIPINQGDVCQKKIKTNSWHLCGLAPATGYLKFTNTGSHIVTVFAAASDGIRADPNWHPIDEWNSRDLEGAGVLHNVANKIAVNGSSIVQVAKGNTVYIARADHMATDRTLTVTFGSVDPIGP
jgi:hypothetical protein